MKKTELILEIKKQLKNKLLKENLDLLDSQPKVEYNIEDQIGNFWIVKTAMKESTEDELVQEVDVFSLAEMISQGTVSRADITGMFKMENKARRFSQKSIKGRDKDLKETIKQGGDLLKQLEDKISDIKLEIQALTQKGSDNSMLRDSVSADIDRLYSELSRKEDKLDRLSKSLEAEKPKKDEEIR